MTVETLADAIERAGDPIALLRDSPARPTTFPVAPEFSNWRAEQHSWRSSCALFDQSHHMTDLFVRGPDASRLLSEHAVNSFARFAPGKAKQYVAVGPEGHLIGDAIVIYLAEQSFDLVGHPMVIDWIEFAAATGSYDVTLQRDDNSAVRIQGPPRLFRYELQGPAAPAIVERAIGGPVPEIRFFNVGELTIGGVPVRALRHGMAGQPGFELFGPWADGERVLAALLEAGEPLGLVRVGAMGYSTANLESGWVPAPLPAIFTGEATRAYREWLPAARAGSLGGSYVPGDVADYYLTPYELGYGKTIAFDHDFVGRDALGALAETPQREKVTLVWDPRDVRDAIGSLFEPGLPAKYVALPKARYALYQFDAVHHDGAPAGVSHDCGYIANEQSFLSLASVDAAVAAPGTELTVTWGETPTTAKPQIEPHRQVTIRATVAPAPYVAFAREGYRDTGRPA